MPAHSSNIVTGLTATRSLVVEGAAIYTPTGKPEHEVLSSPAMIMEMELACVDAYNGHTIWEYEMVCPM